MSNNFYHQKARVLKALLFSACVVLISGCATMRQEQAAADMRTRADMAALREAVTKTQGRAEGIEAHSQRLSAELDKLKLTLAQTSGSEAQTARRLDMIEQELNALKAARAQDREQLIDELSAKMAEILAKQSGGGRRAALSSSGYEHIVQASETLSQIAAAYKVSVGAIMEANGIKNPDLLREGQKLFIPQ